MRKKRSTAGLSRQSRPCVSQVNEASYPTSLTVGLPLLVEGGKEPLEGLVDLVAELIAVKMRVNGELK